MPGLCSAIAQYLSNSKNAVKASPETCLTRENTNIPDQTDAQRIKNRKKQKFTFQSIINIFQSIGKSRKDAQKGNVII